MIQGKAVQIILNNSSPDYLALAEVQVFGNVPEPASALLLVVGVGAVSIARRRLGNGPTVQA